MYVLNYRSHIDFVISKEFGQKKKDKNACNKTKNIAVFS